MNKMIRFSLICLLLGSYLLIDKPVQAHTLDPNEQPIVETSINTGLVQKYIRSVETSNNEITYYLLAVYNVDLNETQKLEITEAIQEKIRLLEADIVELNRNIKIDDYSCQTCQLLTTLSISLQHNKNALNELLAYTNAANNNVRLDSLERFFFAKNSSYQNLDWVKRIIANQTVSTE